MAWFVKTFCSHNANIASEWSNVTNFTLMGVFEVPTWVSEKLIYCQMKLKEVKWYYSCICFCICQSRQIRPFDSVPQSASWLYLFLSYKNQCNKLQIIWICWKSPGLRNLKWKVDCYERFETKHMKNDI